MQHYPQEIIRLADLVKFTGLRRTRIEELVEKGEFPKPVKLSERRKAWLAHEVAEWQRKRIAERDRQESD